jgi:hypothetical protein
MVNLLRGLRFWAAEALCHGKSRTMAATRRQPARVLPKTLTAAAPVSLPNSGDVVRSGQHKNNERDKGQPTAATGFPAMI